MEFGDKEWFEKLEKTGTFPSDYVFYVDTNKRISSLCLKSNAKSVSNISYKTIKGWQGAIASVVNCKTPQEYYEECKRLKEKWS